ncbi:MAG: hypothetical protein U0936_04505 [Planctomycetaceae bacterium]
MIHDSLTRLRRLLEITARTNRRRRNLTVNRPEVLEERQMLAATALQAFHRSGQTFITWNEDTAVTGEKYNVYRSASPITTANIGSAEKLTSKWGPLDDNTTLHPRRSPEIGIPATFMINDLGTPLSEDQGLFVYTTPTGQGGTWYYAVTQVTGGTESVNLVAGSNSLSTGVTELVATPSPVLTVSNATGKGRIYTQYMDYAKWNPTFQGYAYNYAVALPDTYDPNIAWPVKLMPHAYGERLRMEPSAEFGWPCIEVFLDDPGGGAPGEHFQTWWYGFAADHNYQTQGSFPTAGRVENFTEQRVLKTIDEVSSMFNVDELRIHSQGHSMGASGSLSLGMRYANVFSGIFGSEPMTNYASSPGFQWDFSVLWGSQAANLPIVNNGVHAGPIKKYDGMGVYNWMNHHEQLLNRRGDKMAFLMVGHGKADDVIDWATQGQPFIAALNAGNVGFTAEQRFGWDHNWMAFDFSLDTMFSPTDGGLSAWAYPRNVSFPGITNASGSGPNVPGTTGTNFYNMQFEWSVPWNHFHNDIVDMATRYEITVRSNTVEQTADVTPQRRQAFNPMPGATVTWTNINNVTGQIVQSGTLIVDADGLVTLPAVTIGTGEGNRFVLTVPASGTYRPVLTSPLSTTENQKPTLTWTGTPDALDYDLQVTNISTGKNVVLRTTVAGLSYTPSVALGIGFYRVDLRSRNNSGQYSAWSDAKFFRIGTPPTVDPVASISSTGRPTFRWNNLLGAAQYKVMVRNLITGQVLMNTVNRMDVNTYQFPNSFGIGRYSVSVSGIDASGLSGNWSTAQTFQSNELVTLVSPNASTFSSLPTLTWLPVTGATSYEMLLRNLRTGATVASELSLTATSWTPTTALPASDYRWSIRAKVGSVLTGSWSLSKDFNNGGRPVLLTASGTTTDRTPTILWSAVTGAQSYILRIVRVDTNALIQDVRNLTGNSFTPLTDLPPRQYRMWVRSVSTTGALGEWSTSIVITITSTELPKEDNLAAIDSVVPASLPQNSRPQSDSEKDDVSQNDVAQSNTDADPSQAGSVSQEVSVSAPDSNQDIDIVMSRWALGA